MHGTPNHVHLLHVFCIKIFDTVINSFTSEDTGRVVEDMADMAVEDKPVEGIPEEDRVDRRQVGYIQAGRHNQAYTRQKGVHVDLCETFAVAEEPALAQISHLAYQAPLCVVSACTHKQCSIQHWISS